jgi:hypothetical protein
MARKMVVDLPRKRSAANAEDLAASLRPLLTAEYGVELVSLEGEPSAGALHGRAKAWVPLEKKELGRLDGVHVALPVDLAVRLEGGRAIVTVGDPAAAELSEATSFVAGLAAREQIAAEQDKPSSRANYRVEIDARGRRLLKRLRSFA